MQFQRAYVEITNICNRNCSFCPGTVRKPGVMTAESFSIAAQKLRPYTDYLYLHLMGEPLTHPMLAELLHITESLAFQVVLTTNGTLLAQKKSLLLRAKGLYKVNLSLHSFEANKVGELEGYLKQCTDFVQEAAAAGILCNLRLWNMDSEDMQGENRLNPEILQQLEKAFPPPWLPNTRGFQLREKVFLEWGERFDWQTTQPTQNPKGVFCHALRQQLAVLCDGTVVPCCLDNNGLLPLGNLFTEELESILQKPETLSLQKSLADGSCREELCRSCGFAARFRRSKQVREGNK